MPLAQRYTITAQLAGSGGWTLHRACSVAGGEPVLVELLDPSRGEPNGAERLRRAQEAAGALGGPPALRAVAIGTYRGIPALVHEAFDGLPLAAEAEPLAPERALPLAAALAGALAALHRGGVVHRQLRPECVLVRGDGEVRLLDLGLSAPPARAPARGAPPPLLEASLPYLAPEQTGRLDAAVDGRADLYALGVILYRLLTGRLPFEARDALEWIHCHVARVPTPAAEAAPGVPAPLSAVVARLLAKMPDDRYQSAGGLRHDLERCLAAQREGRADPFPLGERDRPERLQLPQRLYGRGDEVLALLRAFHAAAHAGRPGLALVSGAPGVGKSAVVLELQRHMVGQHGFFAAGKFDAAEQDVPYSTLVRALRDLVLSIASGGPARIAEWRERIVQAVGPGAQVLVDVFPALEAVIGRQPPAPAVPPEEARNRFSLLLRRLIGVFAREEHPLALFLDDLQWADAGSLSLVRDLVADPATGHLLVAGAYRDSEVPPGHPLLATVAEVRAAGAPITELHVAPLAAAEIARFVADALRCEPAEAAALAAVVHEKSGGNPFYAVQLLAELHDAHLVTFDVTLGRWRWDVDRIRAKGFTDSVVDLVVSKLRRLPRRTAEVVERAASIGGTADLGTLAAIHGRSEEDTRADLAEAEHAGLVVSGRDGYRLVHDRVQEAAWSLVPPEARAASHLRAGRLLLSYLGGDRLEERIFDVVNQLDRGLAHVDDPLERAEILRLNLVAARKAKGAVAFESARSYFGHAAALLPADAWDTRYADAFELWLELAECEYLAGHFERADALLGEVLERVRNPRDRARAAGVRLRLYQVAGRWGDAVEVALGALGPLGVAFPQGDAAIAAATREALAAVPGWLRGRRIADLAAAPLATDPDVRAAIALLVTTCPCANVARPALFPLMVLTALRLSLEHGNTEESCFAYSAWATLLIALAGDVDSACAFSEMSLALNERLGDARMRGTLLYLHASFIHFWKQPFAAVLPLADRALEACLQVGDFVFAGYLQAHRTWVVLESGAPLDRFVELASAHLATARVARSEVIASTIELMLGVAGRLAGPAPDAARLAAHLDGWRRLGFATGVAVSHVCELTVAVLQGRWEDALAEGRAVEPIQTAIAAQPFEASFHSGLAVALAALAGRADGPLRAEVAERLPGEVARLERWAAACPANFGTTLALVRAEVARSEGRDLDALREYEASAARARDAGLVHREALARELAAAFCRERGLGQAADDHLGAARDLYRRWGAHEKVRELEERHPALRLARPGSPAPGGAAPLDLLSVVKASQSISREIVAERLVERLLTVALELGGARRGALVLARGDALVLEAEATLEPDGVSTRALASEPVDRSTWVPAALVRRAWITREPVIAERDAADAPAPDGPGARRPRARSQLALPIGQQARIVGVLYLENDLVAGAFTRERLTALELIGFQAAISVENARLFHQAQRTSAALSAANAQLKAEMRERSEAEAARAAAEVQLRQAQKMQSVGLLAGGVAHDFNNLLTPILGNADCIADDLGPGHPAAELLAEIRDAAQRARDLTRQLLAVGRRQILELRRVDLGALVAGFERMIRRVVREDIRLELHVPGDLAAVRADEGQLGQVLLNLAVNAQDAMPRGGVLTLAARNEHLSAADPRPAGLEPGEYVVLSVSDTGTGMDLATQERLFEPFFTTKGHGKGTGLGLSTAYGIVRQHGGIVTVVSEPGRGSTFEVYLPRLAGDAAPAPAPDPAPAVARGAGETVLVVEDEPAVRHTATELVRRLGYRVLAAADVASGERTALDEGGRIDLLLTDVVMPGANGKQAFERLRALCPGLRVVYMSGYASEVVVHRGVVDEGVHFIQKPLSLEALGVKLRQALGR